MTSISLISLGCAKNLVDSEHMLSALRTAGYTITNSMADADVAIINTCGFIEAAKTEARSLLIKDALSDVMDAVLYVNQTFVDTLKAKGEFTQSAWEEAKKKAYNAALLTVSEESKKAVACVYGSFDNWLQLKIEASVQAAKTNKDVIL